MKPVSNKLRVVHIPQVGSSIRSFYIDVADEIEAARIANVIAMQHNWLYENNFIPDFSNIITVEMYNPDSKEWENYYNEEECMEWEEYEEHLSTILESLNLQQNW